MNKLLRSLMRSSSSTELPTHAHHTDLSTPLLSSVHNSYSVNSATNPIAATNSTDLTNSTNSTNPNDNHNANIVISRTLPLHMSSSVVNTNSTNTNAQFYLRKQPSDYIYISCKHDHIIKRIINDTAFDSTIAYMFDQMSHQHVLLVSLQIYEQYLDYFAEDPIDTYDISAEYVMLLLMPELSSTNAPLHILLAAFAEYSIDVKLIDVGDQRYIAFMRSQYKAFRRMLKQHRSTL